MKPFTDKQLRLIGAPYVFENLKLHSPFGKALARAISPFARHETDLLERELDNVERAKLYTDQTLARVLSKFRDMRGSLRKLDGAAGRALGEVELFELKNFLLNLSELAEAFLMYNNAAAIKGHDIKGINIRPMENALTILDPEGTRLRSFYVSERYSKKLGEIRDKKRRLDVGLNAVFCKELEKERLAAAAAEEDEELAVRTELTARLSAFEDLFWQNVDAVGRLDMVLAKGELARRYGCVRPVITENSLVLTDVYSPEVAAVLEGRGERVTPVSLGLAPGAAVLTGANMGGKSVALKTLVQCAYLCQCGFLAFANAAALPVFDHMDFVFEDESDVRSGLSSFGAEMMHVNAILEHAKGFSLIVLDEPARGTNPPEGCAIAAGLAACLNAMPSISILSTHYDNVAKSEYNCYQTAGLRKDADIPRLSADKIPSLMDYRLVKTTSNKRAPNDALTICKLLGVDPGLLRAIEAEL